jgi:predicted transcriptional regulator
MGHSPGLPTAPPATPGNVAGAESDQPAQRAPVEPARLLEILGDEYTYRVFEAVVEEPRSGRELVKATGASKATVYRRLQDLEEAGLVDSTVQIAADGNHRQRFHAAVSSIEVRFDADGFDAHLRANNHPGVSATGARPPADD